MYGFHTLSAPTIVNYTLSVELALKLLHSHVGSIPMGDGHNLEGLYESLPASVRKNLPHLSDCAADIARYFVDWRYPFEKEFLVGEYDNPRRAFIECYREIKRLRPEMPSLYEKLWGAFDPDWIQPGHDHPPRWELRLVAHLSRAVV